MSSHRKIVPIGVPPRAACLGDTLVVALVGRRETVGFVLSKAPDVPVDVLPGTRLKVLAVTQARDVDVVVDRVAVLRSKKSPHLSFAREKGTSKVGSARLLKDLPLGTTFTVAEMPRLDSTLASLAFAVRSKAA